MYKYFFKRLFDFILGLIALPFVILAIIIFAPIIFLTDRGPVFYCAPRIGKKGKVYKMIKFRSMTEKRNGQTLCAVWRRKKLILKHTNTTPTKPLAKT